MIAPTDLIVIITTLLLALAPKVRTLMSRHRCWTILGHECSFPFKFQGKWHSTCTEDTSENLSYLWCPLKDKEAKMGKVVAATWDYCNLCTGVRVALQPKDDPVVKAPIISSNDSNDSMQKLSGLRDRMVLTGAGLEGIDMGNLGTAASESRELQVMATAKDNRHEVKIIEKMSSVGQEGGGRGKEDFS